MDVAESNFQPNFTSCSVESLLSVPLRYIFRETQTAVGRGNATGQKSYIFSKSEASTLLRVSMVRTK